MVAQYKSPIVKDKNGRPVIFHIKRAHQYWAERARKDISLFGEFVFGNRPAKHHKEWLGSITDPNQRFILIVSSRGFGKTETVKTAVSWYMGHYPLDTNVITSVSRDQASKRLMDIKDVILFNERYQLVFPWIKQDINKPNTMVDFNIWDARMRYNNYVQKRSQLGTAKTMSLFAVGMGGKNLIGNRITGLSVVDDPHDEDAAYSPITRQRAVDWYIRTFLNCLTGSRSKAIVITTRWHEEDLAGYIIENMKDVYSILETPAEYEENGARISNWPELWPIEKLDRQEQLIGSRMYRALYLNDINALSGDVFQVEWLNNHLPMELPEMERIVIAVDPAVTVKTTSDYTAIALLGIDRKRNVYLLEMIRDKMHPKDLSQRLNRLFNFSKENYGRCDKVLIEKYGTQVLLVDKMISDTELPIEGIALKGDKRTKAQSLEVVASNQKFFAKWSKEWGTMLRSEMLAFPAGGKNDDMVDAIAIGVDYLTSKSGKVKTKVSYFENPYML